MINNKNESMKSYKIKNNNMPTKYNCYANQKLDEEIRNYIQKNSVRNTKYHLQIYPIAAIHKGNLKDLLSKWISQIVLKETDSTIVRTCNHFLYVSIVQIIIIYYTLLSHYSVIRLRGSIHSINKRLGFQS